MTSFDNNFGDFSLDNCSDVLNETGDAISTKFRDKINKFKAVKLNELTTLLKSATSVDGTTYTGSAGLALYYLICSLNKNPIPFDTIQEAATYINLSKLKGRKISFLCGDSGPLAIMAVISYKLGTRRTPNIPEYKLLVERLLGLISLLNASPDELLYGKVGYLYALLFVSNHISGQSVIPATHVEEVTRAVLKSGKQFSVQMKSASPLLWQWHDKIYLGAAHGMAGILYMLLQARAYIDEKDVTELIKPSIDWLLNHRFPSGNFPSSIGSKTGDKLVQWCHGAPGFVPLCILAYQVFGEDKYLKVAVECGEVIWVRGLCTKGYSICHGVSGNAYAFLQLYQVTKKPVYLYRACGFMEWCALERPGSQTHAPDRPASLFEGVLGRIYLAEDIVHPLNSKFPAFCL